MCTQFNHDCSNNALSFLQHKCSLSHLLLTVIKCQNVNCVLFCAFVFAGLMEMGMWQWHNLFCLEYCGYGCSIVHFELLLHGYINFYIVSYRMIHAMRIKDGKATYVSRYVKTSRLKQEEYFGGAKFMKVSLLIWLKNLNCLNGHSPSSTAFHFSHSCPQLLYSVN